MTPDANDADASPSPDPSGDLHGDYGDMTEAMMDGERSDEKSPSNPKDGGEPQVKKNAKDPSRPRRKKARRACYACQRAHLTCGKYIGGASTRAHCFRVCLVTVVVGDERPCLRCIKRGLQDHCQDGVRKKAKYLHDAPNEALLPPGMTAPHKSVNGTSNSSVMAQNVSTTPQTSQTPYFSSQPAPVDFNAFPQSTVAGNNQSPTSHDTQFIDPFTNQQAMMPSSFGSVSQQISSMPPPPTLEHNSSHSSQQNQQFPAPFIDPTDPSFFNFDISGLNFGNHYGALEFGMLGHMSSAAVDAPDEANLMNPMNAGGAISFETSVSSNAYPSSGIGYPYSGSNNGFGWQAGANPSSRNNSGAFGAVMPGPDANKFEGQAPNAFAIGEGNASVSTGSPSNVTMDFTGYNSSPVSSANYYHPRNQQQSELARQQAQQQRHNIFSGPVDGVSDGVRKKKRDPSYIYSSVQAPYSYTTGFHALTALLQKRFSSQKTVRIAKALASIRPSFIACTKELNKDDLIFMEKCFQRTLLQYDDFLNAYGCPTLICRRTGEVAAVSKEFALLTGWRKDLLLGKEPNLNINMGGTSGAGTGTSSRGAATPSKMLNGGEPTPGRPQPVFLAELLDDDSVIQFYEDFAELAFGDPRGYVMKPCKLLKYKTKTDAGWTPEEREQSARTTSGLKADGSGERRASGNPLFSGEAGMNLLGEKDGKVDCMYCWTVKRDVFDIPMLIVMNVSAGIGV